MTLCLDGNVHIVQLDLCREVLIVVAIVATAVVFIAIVVIAIAIMLALWAFFGLAKLPATALPERAVDFTLPDQDGHPVTLAAELAKGPVLLVFFRGHW